MCTQGKRVRMNQFMEGVTIADVKKSEHDSSEFTFDDYSEFFFLLSIS